MAKYASTTSVSTERSRTELERILSRYGATAFGYLSQADRAVVMFEANERRIRFDIPLPDRDAREFTHHARGRRSPEVAHARWEQACRQRWRALVLVVKAKLEAVEAGISEFDDEFLAFIALPDGSTVGEWARPQIAEVYASGSMPALMPGTDRLERST